MEDRRRGLFTCPVCHEKAMSPESYFLSGNIGARWFPKCGKCGAKLMINILVVTRLVMTLVFFIWFGTRTFDWVCSPSVNSQISETIHAVLKSVILLLSLVLGFAINSYISYKSGRGLFIRRDL
jgi:hypothetical protein